MQVFEKWGVTVVLSDGELDPLGPGRLHLAPQISGDDPLKFPSGLVIDLSSEELGVGAHKELR